MGMNHPGTPATSINIVPPATGGEKLLFRVFDHASPIGYARLKKLTPRRQPRAHASAMSDPESVEAYELRMIEIAQNYRHNGIGSTLLDEVIRYCRARNVPRLTGEIKGDTPTLRHWYMNHGFAVDSRDRIELLPVSRLSGNGCAAT